MELQTHGAKRYPSSVPLRSPAKPGWSTLAAELRTHDVSETPVIAPQQAEVCLVVVGNDSSLVKRTIDSRCQKASARTGPISLSPTGANDDVVTITAPVAGSMHLYMPATLFRRLSDEFNLPPSSAHSTRSIAGLRDDVISSTARSILSEMTDETASGRMYIEAASLMLAARILHKHFDGDSSAITTSHSHQVDDARIRRVLDYILTNIAKEITIAELARVAALSTFHFARTFTRAIGISPHRYISRLRLQNAMTEIAAGRLPLAQIAFNAGFSSQASFTRAFHRATGMTPAEYRRRPR
jgi:AraC family transcriptional regulator